MAINFHNVRFLKSVYDTKKLPEPLYPEVAFAGRSNVGKSSLINRLLNRKNMVKTSSRPGKTQSLNYFVLDDKLYLVDLPGYGYAKVSHGMKSSWQNVITSYLEHRDSLACVIVIIDLRHELKEQYRQLVEWLRYMGKTYLPVYTKADKLPRNKQVKHAAALDAGLNIHPDERIIFSAKSGQGCEKIQSVLASYCKE